METLKTGKLEELLGADAEALGARVHECQMLPPLPLRISSTFRHAKQRERRTRTRDMLPFARRWNAPMDEGRCAQRSD